VKRISRSVIIMKRTIHFPPRPSQQGSAFVISILILFVLSVLGMALMLTTTTEKDIAINYRWGEQAFFNADAALEYGKNVLGDHLLVDGDFVNVLPPARTDATVPDASAPWGEGHPDRLASCDPTSPDCRDYQYFVDHCPPGAPGPCVRVYIGRVLRRRDDTKVQYDFRLPGGDVPGDVDADGEADLEGTVTLWVRRPIVGTRDYGAIDGANPIGLHDRVILTAEGTAPGAMGAGAGRPVSLRRLEMTVRRPTAGIEGDRYGTVTSGSDTGTRQEGYDPVGPGT
jgi:PilX N-terminal